MFRKFLMRLSWHVKNLGDDIYRLGHGGEDHVLGPQLCGHCGKWNFEKVSAKRMTESVPIAMSAQEARDIVASQEKKIERLEIMVSTRDQIIRRLESRLSLLEPKT